MALRIAVTTFPFHSCTHGCTNTSYREAEQLPINESRFVTGITAALGVAMWSFMHTEMHGSYRPKENEDLSQRPRSSSRMQGEPGLLPSQAADLTVARKLSTSSLR